MPAQCAQCMGVVVPGENFATAGTEIFHRSCVERHGTTESVGNRQRRELAALEQRMLAAESEKARAARDLRREKATAQGVVRMLNEARQQRDDANAARNALAEQVDGLRARAAEMERERDKARQDLALAQLPAPAPKDPEDKRDDTEKRFAMLELD